MADPERPTIAQLEDLIDQEVELEILPDGRIVPKVLEPGQDPRPLTFRQHLGGEY